MADGFKIRTPLARVRGLGAARSGTEHFWRQRLTAVANVPLTIAFVLILVSLLRRNHAAAAQILGSPLAPIILLLFLVSVPTHIRLASPLGTENYIRADPAPLILVT